MSIYGEGFKEKLKEFTVEEARMSRANAYAQQWSAGKTFLARSSMGIQYFADDRHIVWFRSGAGHGSAQNGKPQRWGHLNDFITQQPIARLESDGWDIQPVLRKAYADSGLDATPLQADLFSGKE